MRQRNENMKIVKELIKIVPFSISLIFVIVLLVFVRGFTLNRNAIQSHLEKLKLKSEQPYVLIDSLAEGTISVICVDDRAFYMSQSGGISETKCANCIVYIEKYNPKIFWGE